MMDFLPYNMPERFNKIGHCLTDIVIAVDEFTPFFSPRIFLGIMVHISTVC